MGACAGGNSKQQDPKAANGNKPDKTNDAYKDKSNTNDTSDNRKREIEEARQIGLEGLPEDLPQNSIRIPKRKRANK